MRARFCMALLSVLVACADGDDRLGDAAGADATRGAQDGAADDAAMAPTDAAGPDPDAALADAPGPSDATATDAQLALDAAEGDARADDAGALDAAAPDASPMQDAASPDASPADAGPCMPVAGLACDPILQCGCPPADDCVVVDGTGTARCQPHTGALMPGVACSASRPSCAAGSICAVAVGGGILQCRQLCEFGAGQCPPAEVCGPVRGFPMQIGACLPQTIAQVAYVGP